MGSSLWDRCLDRLQDDLTSQQFNTWVRPLQVVDEGQNCFKLLAPNRFVLDWVSDKYLSRISEILAELSEGGAPRVHLEIGSRASADGEGKKAPATAVPSQGGGPGAASGDNAVNRKPYYQNNNNTGTSTIIKFINGVISRSALALLSLL